MSNKLFYTILFLSAILAFPILGCEKKQTPVDFISSNSTEENILKIAPTKFVFNKWVEQVLKTKGIEKDYKIVEVSYEEIDNFKMSEIIVEVEKESINMFIATMFSFKAPPSLQKLSLSPETELVTPTRTLIFSSGDKVNLNVEDGIYTFDALSNSLYYIGADIITP